MALAIFDLDNTLIAGDSDYSWGEFIVEKGIVNADHYREANERFYLQYQQGGLDVYEYLHFALEPLTRFNMAELADLHRQFMAEKIAPMRLQKADTLLQQHRDAGDYLLIMTSTNSFVTGPIAAALGVDAILASEAEIIDNRYTGNIVGTPCFQGGKVTRLHEWLNSYNGDQKTCYFYSDSINDLPLLSEVNRPVVVDPDERLRAHANMVGWPIISLRN